MKSAKWIAGGVLGAAAGTALVAGRAYHNRISEVRKHVTELPDDLPALLSADREYTITADDGVALSVEEVDPADGGAPEFTVILIHGYTLDRRSWLYQR
ncbi:MAG: alpha/beta fold hydrolase, partial [Pseudonocardiaceae bacterium]